MSKRDVGLREGIRQRQCPRRYAKWVPCPIPVLAWGSFPVWRKGHFEKPLPRHFPVFAAAGSRILFVNEFSSDHTQGNSSISPSACSLNDRRGPTIGLV